MSLVVELFAQLVLRGLDLRGVQQGNHSSSPEAVHHHVFRFDGQVGVFVSDISSVFSVADTMRLNAGVENTEDAGFPRYCSRRESCKTWMAAGTGPYFCRSYSRILTMSVPLIISSITRIERERPAQVRE